MWHLPVLCIPRQALSRSCCPAGDQGDSGAFLLCIVHPYVPLLLRRPSSGSSRRWTGSRPRSCTSYEPWTASMVGAALVTDSPLRSHSRPLRCFGGCETGAGAPVSVAGSSDMLAWSSQACGCCLATVQMQRACCCWTWRGPSGVWSGATKPSGQRQVRRCFWRCLVVGCCAPLCPSRNGS